MEQFDSAEKREQERTSVESMAIGELHAPLRNIFVQLHEHIDKGDYQLIIGDDASGRTPTLIVEKALKKISQTRGLPEPKVLFFAGSRAMEMAKEIKAKKEGIVKEIDRAERNWKKDWDHTRALIVTDTIGTGVSLKPLCDALKEYNISYDIATIGLMGNRETLGKFLGGRVVDGDSSRSIPLIYSSPQSGVRKNPLDIFSKPLAKHYKEMIAEASSDKWKERYTKNMEELSEQIASARKDVAILANELATWYENKYPPASPEHND